MLSVAHRIKRRTVGQRIMIAEGIRMKWTWHNLRYCPRICLKGIRKTIKIYSQDRQCVSRTEEMHAPRQLQRVPANADRGGT